ncbi:RNase adaptor protein for sRNA GlmZ degradation [Saccharothrix tamanrassetensis]|uniref:RNase adaptor protein for sRNA GlmZ degradation n=1 Tax=Saccharothrix tamanrassetensis TaxID=1051531 RepID=A0A841CCU5_9PSEU|nr:hypothetical protein [Saccharothrix tamanrassetensis]MBB5953998.1 RNase adaptor protein for sRNA GlmZ degradation [Saccharothrix tamanrassetensis]
MIAIGSQTGDHRVAVIASRVAEDLLNMGWRFACATCNDDG